jgi:hypothetical protein
MCSTEEESVCRCTGGIKKKREHNMNRSSFNRVVVGVAAVLAIVTMTNARAAESPPVIEAFACNFLDGKDMADLENTIDYYESQRSKMGSDAIEKMRSVTWQVIRGRVAYDLIWLNTNLTLSEWGSATTAIAESKAGQSVQERFDEVLECDASGVYTNDLLYRTEKDLAQDGAFVIESYRCKLHEGQSIAGSDAAIEAWRPVFAGSMKSADTAAAVLRRSPVISATGFDLNYVVAWDDLQSYADGTSAYQMNPGSAKPTEMFNSTHRCESALFNGRVVVAPAE